MSTERIVDRAPPRRSQTTSLPYKITAGIAAVLSIVAGAIGLIITAANPHKISKLRRPPRDCTQRSATGGCQLATGGDSVANWMRSARYATIRRSVVSDGLRTRPGESGRDVAPRWGTQSKVPRQRVFCPSLPICRSLVARELAGSFASFDHERKRTGLDNPEGV